MAAFLLVPEGLDNLWLPEWATHKLVTTTYVQSWQDLILSYGREPLYPKSLPNLNKSFNKMVAILQGLSHHILFALHRFFFVLLWATDLESKFISN